MAGSTSSALRGGERPPAPWSNVLANPDFGCLVTEAGGGYTWAGNSQMNRLTPWSNDPVSDPPGEVVYLRDEETGEFWTPTPAPCGGEATTVVRHGQGYTRFTQDQSRAGAGPPRPDLADRSGQAVPPAGQEHRRPAPTTVGDVLRPSGCWACSATRPLCRWCARSTRRPARCSLPTPGLAISPGRSLSPTWPPPPLVHDRSRRVPGPRGHSGGARRPGAGAALRPRRRTRRPLRRADDRAGTAAGRKEEIVFVLGQAETADEARRLAAAYADPAAPDERWRKSRRSGIASSGPSRSARLTPRST